MKKSIILFLAIVLSGCLLADPKCSEKTVGKTIENKTCWPVGFGIYDWQERGKEVSPVELFYYDHQQKTEH